MKLLILRILDLAISCNEFWAVIGFIAIEGLLIWGSLGDSQPPWWAHIVTIVGIIWFGRDLMKESKKLDKYYKEDDDS